MLWLQREPKIDYLELLLNANPTTYTFCLLKPDPDIESGLRRAMNIIYAHNIQCKDFFSYQLNRKDVKALYWKHYNKDFYPRNEDYLTSGPCKLLLLHSNDLNMDVVENFRNKVLPEIRGRRLEGTPPHLNIAHASDSYENAFREILYFFQKPRNLRA